MAPGDVKSCVHGVQSCRSTRIVVLSVAGHGTELRTHEQMSGYYMDTNLSQLHCTLAPHGAVAVCFLATPGAAEGPHGCLFASVDARMIVVCSCDRFLVSF